MVKETSINRIFRQLFLGTVISFTVVHAFGQAGAPDPNFTAGTNSYDFHTVQVLPSGKILVEGDFDRYAGVVRDGLALLNANGTVDTGFLPDPGLNGYAHYFKGQADGRILFLQEPMNGSSEVSYQLFRLLANGTLDPAFPAADVPNVKIRGYEVESNGKIVLWGEKICRINANGKLDSTFHISLVEGGIIEAGALQPDGRILVYGTFTRIDGKDRRGLAMLKANGKIDTDFVPGLPADTHAYRVEREASGTFLVIAYILGTNGPTMLRLKTNGAWDPSWTAPSWSNTADFYGNTYINGILTQGNKVLVWGSFTHINGTSRPHLARLNQDGSIDASFVPPIQPGAILQNVVFQPTGRILLTGKTGPNYGQSLPIVRLFADGTLDAGFDLVAEGNWDSAGGPFTISNPVSFDLPKYMAHSISIQPDGKILATLNYYSPPFNGGGVIIIGPQPPDPPSRLLRFLGDGNYPPHRPLIPSINSVSANLTKISWNDVEGETGYTLQRAEEGTWTDIATLGPGILHYDDDDVDGSTNYFYRVRAFNAHGPSTWSTEAFATSPGAFASFTASSEDAAQVRLDWTDVDGEWYYEIYRMNGVPPGISGFSFSLDGSIAGMTLVGQVASGTTTFFDESVASRTTYTYQIVARNVAGKRYSSGQKVVVPSDQPPVIPLRLSAAPMAGQKILLSWPDLEWETSYLLEWSPDGQTAWRTLATLNADTTTYEHGPGLPLGQTLFYRLKSTNTTGSSAPSSVTSIEVQSFDWLPPGQVDTSFNPANMAGLLAVKRAANGALYFTRDYYGTKQFKRAGPNGEILDFHFPYYSASGLTDYLPLSSGKVLICGDLSGSKLARLNADGSYDYSFTPLPLTGTAYSLFPLKNGKIILAGTFTQIGDLNANGIARLNADGTLDSTFNMTGFPPGQGGPRKLAEQSNHKLVLLQGNNTLIRLHENGQLDPGFGQAGKVTFDSNINALALQGDDGIIAGGQFSSVNDGYAAYERNRICGLDANGKLNPAFNIGKGFPVDITIGSSSTSYTFQSVSSLGIDQQGRIWAAGSLVRYDGIPVQGLVRLFSDGALDVSIPLGTGIYTEISQLILKEDETFYAAGPGGLFNRYYQDPVYLDNPDPELWSQPESTSSFRLEWKDFGAETYHLEAWNSSSLDWVQIYSGTGRIYTLSGAGPGITGSFRIKSVYPDGASVYTHSYIGRSYTRFEGWKLAHGLAADQSASADTDGNGFPLLMEYALGLKPGHSGPLPVLGSTESLITLSYVKHRSELSYLVEASTDLIHWSSEGVVEKTGPEGITASSPINGSRAKFLRLRVLEP